MTWESGSSDQQRLRAGYAVLSLGVLVLLCVWVLSVMRGPEGVGEVALRGQKIEPPSGDQVWSDLSAVMMLSGTILLIVFFVSVILLVRMSRNYRKYLIHKPPKPTASSDVWKMHKVPDIPEEGDTPADTESREPPH